MALEAHPKMSKHFYLTGPRLLLLIMKSLHHTSYILGPTRLGPIFFLIYMNDLPYQTRSKVRLLFADDTAIYLAVSSLEDAQILQQDLDHLHLWELDWDTEFNPSKCVVIHITRSRTPVQSQYLLQGQVLESFAGSIYLGVGIRNNLPSNSHIQNVFTLASGPLALSREK